MEDRQRQVAAFVDEHDLEAPPEFRLLDIASEVGELATDANESTGYGASPDDLEIDADAALEEALEKYERRLEADGSPGTGE
jgi:NTP pyrophosphatase (non-canonical NTP hydrolase)